jgi:hypothetical protein
MVTPVRCVDDGRCARKPGRPRGEWGSTSRRLRVHDCGDRWLRRWRAVHPPLVVDVGARQPGDGLVGGVASLRLAALIAALAPLPRLLVALLAGSFVAAITWMRCVFASNESSTAVFVFYSGWLYGVPVAAAVAFVATRPRRT